MDIASSSTELLRRVVIPVVERLLPKRGAASAGVPRVKPSSQRVVLEALERRELLSTTYVSDLQWSSATNGWGPVERDLSNGGQGAGDGNALTLNGVTYTKGLGTNADASITYQLGAQYSSFLASVGVDDEEGTNGSVVFQVIADGTKIYDSGLMTATSATQAVDVSVAGVQQLTLITNDGGDGTDYDHGDWANARLIGPPVAPSAVTAVAISPSAISISWEEASSDLNGFVIQRSTDGTTFSTIATVASDTLSYTDGGLTTNSEYFYRVQATSTAGASGVSAVANANTLAAPGSATYLSDLSWTSATNGWGPVERDMSVGGEAADDGDSIMLNGVTYDKGLGVNALSTITYSLGGQYARFLADVGVDDTEQYNGSVVFQVYADGTQIYDSGTMVPSSPTQSLNLNVVGAQQLQLVVGDAGDGTDYDKADWAGSRLLTIPSVPTDCVAQASSPSAVDISWSASTGSVSSYVLQRSNNDIDFSTVATLPSDATQYRDVGLVQNATYQYRVIATGPAGDSSASSSSAVTTLPTLAVTYLSDLSWSSATNGWGPVEQDESNGGQDVGDGNPIELNGNLYEKGLGTNADSTIIYNLDGAYGRFISDVGVDDEEQYNGTVVFQVYADGTKVFDSGTMTPTSPTKHIDIDVTGVQQLQLVVDDAGDGTAYDHGDWAGACLVKTPTAPEDLSANAENSSTVVLTWTAAADAAGYYVFRDTPDITAASPLNDSLIIGTSYSDTTANGGSSYSYRVEPYNAAGLGPASTVSVTTPPSTGTGDGLIGSYYSDTTFTNLQLSRVDPSVSFDWEGGSPDPLVPTDNFTARWVGEVQPRYSESYTFETDADDGARLWVNGQLLIDGWSGSGDRTSSPVALVAGEKYDITLEFREDEGNAHCDLYWSSASEPRAIIPQSQLYAVGTETLTAPTDLLATPSTEGAVDLSWSDDDSTSSISVERAVAGSGTYAPVATVAAGITSYHDQWLADGTQYTYRVRAVAPAGVSSYSENVTGTTANAADNPADHAWIDEAVPPGASLGADGDDSWTWVTSSPSPVSGLIAHQSNLAEGEHQHYFSGATATMSVGADDKLFAYVYLDPASPPSEVMLQWNDGSSWDHRAYWGADQISWGNDGEDSRRYMGALPATGGWVRLEVPASEVGLGGVTVSGMAFALYGGRATWDRAGVESSATSPVAPTSLTITAAYDSEVDLTWSINSDNESGFVVERKDGNGTYETIATVPRQIATYQDLSATAGGQYTYRVKAVNAVGDSAFSNEAQAAPVTPQLPYADSFARPDSAFVGGAWYAVSGAWNLSDGQVVTGGTAGDHLLLVHGIDESDVLVSATVSTPGAYVYATPPSGVVAGAANGDLYVAELGRDADTDYVSIRRMVDGVWDNQPLATQNVVVSGATAQISLEVVGTSLAVMLNGEVEAEISLESSIAPGTVGLYASDAGLAFGDFSATATSESNLSATLPFADAFDRSNSAVLGNGWTESSGGWAIQDGSLGNISNDGSDAVAVLADVSAGDVVATADVNVPGRTGAWGGIIVRGQGSSDGYVGRLRRDDNNPGLVDADIGRVSDGQWTTLATALVSTSDQGSGQICLEADGSTLNLYLNDRVILTGSDGTFTDGSVGVITNQPGVTFDNVEIHASSTESPTGVTLPFSDNFSRSTGSRIGSDWTETGGDLLIAGGELTHDQPTGESTGEVNGLSASDVVVSADVDLSGALNGGAVALDARVTATQAYRGELKFSGGVISAEIDKWDGSTWTNIDSRPISVDVGTLRFEVIGDVERLFLNGRPVALASDSTITAAGTVGVMLQDTAVTLDNFSVTAGQSAPSTETATLPLTDDFNRPDTAYLPATWSLQSGELVVGQDELQGLADGESRALLTTTVVDASIVADVDLTEGGSAVGFDARVSGTSCYRAQLRSSYGSYFAEILREVNGTWTTIDSRTVTWPLLNGRPHAVGTGTLRFDINGDQLGLYLNDKLVASASDANIASAGSIGIYTNGSATLDNLDIVSQSPRDTEQATIPYSDDFDRSDNTVDLGSSWTEQSGDFAIQNDEAVDMAAGISVTTLSTAAAADVVVTGQVSVPAGQTLGLVARYSDAGEPSYYVGRLTSSGGEIWKNVNGTLTELGSATSATSTGELRFEAVGSLLRLFLNNTLLVSVTDTSITTPGAVGIEGNRTVFDGSGSASLDNFQAALPQSVPNAWLTLSTAAVPTVQYWTPGEGLDNTVTGDFDGDGRQDVAGQDPNTGNWVVGLSNADGSFTTSVWATWPSALGQQVVVGDFNGDGRTDIASFDDSTGSWSVATSTGSSFHITTWGGLNSAHEWQHILVGDFTGDGRSDIAAWDSTAGNWTVLQSTGISFVSATWASPQGISGWANALVGDFDGDGRADLAVRETGSTAWSVYQSNGSSFTASSWGPATGGVTPTSAYVGDVNADGKADLILVAADDESWHVDLSTGSSFTPQAWGSRAADLTNVQVGDFDGDGKTDVAGRVSGTNDWRVELSSGTTFSDQYWLTTSAAINLTGVLTANTLGQEKAAAAAFQDVYNNIAYEPYAGEMKGPDATEQTGAGNDWDQAALLISKLTAAGIQARFANGRVSVPTADVIRWLGVKDVQAAQGVLSTAQLNPVLVNAGQADEAIEFDHAWVQALLPGAGGIEWRSLDPSFKFKSLQDGVSGLATSVPFDQSDYLAHVTGELPYEYYEDQVTTYLNANDPGTTVADVPYGGPIDEQTFSAVPAALPYAVVGDVTTNLSIPEAMQHRVRIRLEDVLLGGVWETPIDFSISLPALGTSGITITYTQAADGNYMPELRIDGQIVQASTSEYMVGGDTMRLVIDHLDPGDDTVDRTSTYDREPGQAIGIGLDADQFSAASEDALQQRINDESLAVYTGSSQDQVPAFADGLSLAMMEYLQQNDAQTNIIAGLNDLTTVHATVGDGIIDAAGAVEDVWGIGVPIVAPQMSFDVAGGAGSTLLPTDGTGGQHPARLAALQLTEMNASDLESHVLEQLFDVQALSAVEGIQWANDQGIPVLTIDSSNESELLSELTISAADKNVVQGYVDDGNTVIIPRDTLVLPNWSGTVFISQKTTATSFSEGDAVIGDYLTHGGTLVGLLTSAVGWPGNGSPGSGGPGPAGSPPGSTGGDPVELYTGSFLRSDTDISIPNIGFDLDFTRHYVSGLAIDVGLGQGWTDSYSDRLAFPSNGDVVWTDSNGYEFTFAPISGGGYAPAAGVDGTLVAVTGGYEFRGTDGTTRSFDSDGKLTQLSDRNGNQLNLTYNAQDQLEAVEDGSDSSRRLTFTYVNNHISQIEDFTGRVWTYTYETVVRPSDDSTVYLLTSRTSPSDGQTPAQVLEYGYSDDAPVLGYLTSITDTSDGKSIQCSYYVNGRAFCVTDPEGNKEYFDYDAYHNATTYVDANGNSQIDEFNDDGLTTKQINADGTRTTSVWDGERLQSETDEIGRTESFQYDTAGNVTQEISLDGVETDTTFNTSLNLPTQVTQGSATTAYGYDANGNLTSVTDAAGDVTTMTYNGRGLVTSLTKPNGNVAGATGDYTTTYTYDDAGKVLTATTGLPSTVTNTYDDRGDLLTTTDATGETTTYTYDLLGRLLSTTLPDPDGAGPLASSVTTTSYATPDRTVTTDGLGRASTAVRDGNDRVTQLINADGTYEQFAYDAVGNLIASTDEEGRTTRYVYDSRNRLIQTILPDGASTADTVNGSGETTSTTDALGNRTAASYDSLGRVDSVTDAAGDVTTYGYDSANDITSVTDAMGTTTYARDLLGRVTQVRAPGDQVSTTDYDADGNIVKQTQYDVSGLASIPNDPRTLATSRQHSVITDYDILDRPIEVTEADGSHTYTGYDAAGRTTSTTDAEGNETVYGYDDAGRLTTVTGPDPDGAGPETASVTHYSYDADGNRVAEIDPLGNTTTYAYDALNRLVSTTAPDPDGAGTLTAPVTSTAYDADGEQTSVTDADGNTTFYTYDDRGNITSRRDATGATWSYTYDADDNLASQTDADGQLTRYGYDALGRRTSEQWIGADGTTVLRTIGYTYNDKGQLTNVSDPDSSYTYTYDDAGRVTSVDNTGTPSLPSVVLTQSYDGFGNRTSLGASVAGTTQLTNGYQYDALGRMTAVTQSGSAVANKGAGFTYNALGQLTAVDGYASTNQTGLVYSAEYGYDAAGRLTSLGYTSAADANLAGYVYTYDADGRVTGETDVDGTVAYAYDADSRLTAATGDGLTAAESYAYDATGNRTDAGDATSSGNRLASDGTYDYAYDADGNLLTKTTVATGATTTYTWDYRNRLTDVTDRTAGGTVTGHVHYTYDVFDRRIGQQVDSNGDGTYDSTERYVYDGGSLLLTLSGTGVITHAFLNGPAGANQVLADDAGGSGVTWLLADRLGSVKDVVNSAGTVVDHLQYDSYGTVTAQSDAGDQPRFGYAGMQLDAATGLYYDNARYYDAGTGTFVSQDPSGFAGGNANLYGYVNNDPINYTDLNGLNPHATDTAGRRVAIQNDTGSPIVTWRDDTTVPGGQVWKVLSPGESSTPGKDTDYAWYDGSWWKLQPSLATNWSQDQVEYAFHGFQLPWGMRQAIQNIWRVDPQSSVWYPGKTGPKIPPSVLDQYKKAGGTDGNQLKHS